MAKWLAAIVVVAIIAAAAVLWRSKTDSPSSPVTAASAPQAAATTASMPAGPEPGIQHPVETPSAALAAGDIGRALTDLLGSKAVMAFVQIDDFPRRLVATVDNLGRSHAPSGLWPVNPTPGRFTVEEREGGPVIAADNAMRYTPLVLLTESVDAGRAADLYVGMYPLLQQAYEELGYPKHYFNDRLIAVIDLLLATPEAQYPVKLHLTEVKGPIPSERPWVRYEYADPRLESLSAGQKILLRAGPENGRRLKTRLAGFRAELVKRAAKR